jgi:hypothetical protein
MVFKLSYNNIGSKRAMATAAISSLLCFHISRPVNAYSSRWNILISTLASALLLAKSQTLVAAVCLCHPQPSTHFRIDLAFT